MADLEGSIRIWSKTAAWWSTNNPKPLLGQLAFESDTNKLKIGDGTNFYNDLDYVSGDSAVQFLMPRYSGKKYSFDYTTSTSAAGFGGSTLITCPIRVLQPHYITAITAYVSSADAGHIRLGLYDDNEGYPGDLIIDSGDISCASTGAKTFVFPEPILLYSPLIFPAIMVENGNIGLDYAQGVIPLLEKGGAAVAGAQLRYQPYGGTHGAMPATFQAGLSSTSGWGIILELTKQ